MVWENGPTKISYIMLTIEKTAIQDSYLTLQLVFVIGIFLLISCYCFVRYGRKTYIHDESGARGRRIGSPQQLLDESQTYPDGIRFLRGLLNKPRSSIRFTNKCKNNSLVNEWAALCFFDSKRTGS